MKIIAFYLPQFHEVEINNKHHGKGFTEWTSLKNSKALYEGHNQPRVPLNNNYYNLLDDSVKKWQCQLAKENGIYGFCMYHYWSDEKLLLEKPIEQYLNNKDLDLPFCLCWANHSWSKFLAGSNELIRKQQYGDKKEWENHFNYLLKFFKDERYIKEKNRPLLVIYMPQDIPNCNERLAFYNDLAKKNGFDGIDFAYQEVNYFNMKNKDTSMFKYGIEFEPANAISNQRSALDKFIRRNGAKVYDFIQNTFHISPNLNPKKLETISYDRVWNKIVTFKPQDEKIIPGAFCNWDNTPRKKEYGISLTDVSIEKFKKYMDEQVKRARKVYNKDMIFFNAWNEWAEGCYLEPDTLYKEGFLKAIKEVLENNNEFPNYPNYKVEAKTNERKSNK